MSILISIHRMSIAAVAFLAAAMVMTTTVCRSNAMMMNSEKGFSDAVCICPNWNRKKLSICPFYAPDSPCLESFNILFKHQWQMNCGIGP